MDYCHCSDPASENVNGNIMCLNCRMYYDEQLWKRLGPSEKFNNAENKLYSATPVSTGHDGIVTKKSK